MEIPIPMVVVSRALKYRPNRWLNIIAGAFMALVQVSTLFIGTTTPLPGRRHPLITAFDRNAAGC